MNMVDSEDGGVSRDSGTTLLETVIAVLMLSMFMAGVAALVVQSSKTADMARDHYTAVTLCRNRLEVARTIGFDALSSLRETNFVCNANGGQDQSGAYRRSTEVNTNFLSSRNLSEVKVTVQIWDRNALAFSNECEAVQSIYTRY